MTRVAWLSVLVCLAACEKGAGSSEQQTAPLEPKSPAPADAAPVAKAAIPESSGCPPLVVAVKPDGIWLRDQNSQSVVAPCGGDIDGAALARRLCTLARSAPPGCASVEVAAEPGVRYQQIITVMDAAIAIGLRDVSLTDPASLSLPLRVPPDPTDMVAPACGKPVPDCPSPPPATATAPTNPAPPQPAAPSAPSRPITIDIPIPPGPAAANSLKDAVVVVVAADGSLMVDGKKIATAAEASAGDRVEPLFKALQARKPSGDRSLVLQVDRDIDARLVNRVVITANAAGYQNIMFAVRRKP